MYFVTEICVMTGDSWEFLVPSHFLASVKMAVEIHLWHTCSLTFRPSQGSHCYLPHFLLLTSLCALWGTVLKNFPQPSGPGFFLLQFFPSVSLFLPESSKKKACSSFCTWLRNISFLARYAVRALGKAKARGLPHVWGLHCSGCFERKTKINWRSHAEVLETEALNSLQHFLPFKVYACCPLHILRNLSQQHPT